ncbi:MAG TPA: SurA N-terminal domain-containing protein, partial [Thermoanaerobaculia bacterium]
MLKVLRDNIKYLSWILWVVIGLFVLFVFVDFGAGGLRGGGLGGGNWAAKVGGETVSMEDFADAYRAMDRQNRQRFGEQYTEELAKQMQLPLRAMQQLVSQQIEIAEAHRLGLTVTDDEVRDTILKIPTFQDKDGNFSEENYTNAVQNGFQMSVVK